MANIWIDDWCLNAFNCTSVLRSFWSVFKFITLTFAYRISNGEQHIYFLVGFINLTKIVHCVWICVIQALFIVSNDAKRWQGTIFPLLFFVRVLFLRCWLLTFVYFFPSHKCNDNRFLYAILSMIIWKIKCTLDICICFRFDVNSISMWIEKSKHATSAGYFWLMHQFELNGISHITNAFIFFQICVMIFGTNSDLIRWPWNFWIFKLLFRALWKRWFIQ